MSLYLDGSIVGKLLLAEPETSRVVQFVQRETEVVISSLARLEGLIIIHSLVAGGKLTEANAHKRRVRLDKLMAFPKVRTVPCRATIFQIAEAQLSTVYCPTLDRLHLAVMQDLGLRRLLTNDDQQAAAAHVLGFEVLMPR
ncbi:MAG: type II toxin-antitoxin system VapC family toxin [Verrucomicrobiales bacterium]